MKNFLFTFTEKFIMKKKKIISFSRITYAQLSKIVKLKPVDDEEKFNDWFNFQYSVSDEEIRFLKDLISENKFYISSFTEDELKANFITPLMRRISFKTGKSRDWYQRPLSATINGEKIGGLVDFAVAKGEKEPESPYFFIQEFKRSKHASLPEEQLLAAMLVAMELNKTTLMRGAYIISQNWTFVILEKVENVYQYYLSECFDSMTLRELKQIFINLQAVKLIFCD